MLRLQRMVLAERRFFVVEAEEFRETVDDKIRFLRDMERTGNSLVLVAREAGELVGVLSVRGGHLSKMRHTGKLDMFVAPDARGRGVGRSLLEAAIRWAEGHPEMEKLGLSVFVDNARALALYRAFGFREEGRRPREYRMEDGRYIDDVLMYRFTDGRN